MYWIICCQHSISFLPNFIHLSIAGIIFGGGRRAGGAWAVVMVVSAIESNPVQSLEIEQHDMVSITDCFTQPFSTSIDLVHLTIATVPLFRLIKTVFIAGYTGMWILCTCGWRAANPLPTFSSEIQSNHVTNFNVTMSLCTEDLEHILSTRVPVLPLHVQPRACTVSTAGGGR